MNKAAPTADACLLNKFQVACPKAATKMSASAVTLIGRQFLPLKASVRRAAGRR
jgi:hypothetical protein